MTSTASLPILTPYLWAPTCDACGQSATWWLICRACRHHGTLCRACELDLDDFIDRAFHAPNRPACSDCRASIHPDRWRDLWTVQPIHGAA